MAHAEKLLESRPSGLSSRLLALPADFRVAAHHSSSAQHLSRGKRKRADGYSEADNRFIVQSVQSADQEGKPIPWEWIGSNLQRTTGAVKKQYQRIKPSLDKPGKSENEASSTSSTKRADRVDRTKDREAKKVLITVVAPESDDTSTEESHSESQPQSGTEFAQEPHDGNQTNELRINSKGIWTTIVDSDVSIEVAANGLLALKSASPTSPDDDEYFL